jgi:acyl carrier protein
MGLDTVEILVHIEEEYDITIPDEDAYLLGEVGDLALYIVNSCEQNNGVLIELEPVVNYLKQMLHREFSVPIEKIHLKSHVVKDLGLD